MYKLVCFLLLLPCLVLVMGGCERAQENWPAETPRESSGPANLAIPDLSDRLNVVSSEITMVREEAVTWRDGSLGCPKEGMMYTQALVEGTLIVLRANGKDYQYHSGKGRPPFYCENPEKPAAKPGAD